MNKLLALFALMLLLACQQLGIKDNAPTPDSVPWTKGSFQKVNMDSSAIYAIDRKIKTGAYGYIDRMYLIKDDQLIFNSTYQNDYTKISQGKSGPMGCGMNACKDSSEIKFAFNYYHPYQHPYYRGQQVHSLQSVTKSVAATVIGIAIKNGAIKSVDEPVLSFLDDYDLSKVDERLKKATLKNLLCMQLGIEWHEHDRPFDMTNSTLQMEHSEDWVQYVLDQPMDSAPGQKWVYSSGASHLLSAIIKKTTGSYMDQYTQTHLFKPLGIESFHWKKTPKGLPDCEGGLYLKIEDLAKIGYLYLKDGQWNGQQILPKGWVAEATHPWVDENVPGASGYGYQWWYFEIKGTKIWFALGFGGQLLAILPQRNIVGVLHAWNAFEENHENILRDFALALVE